MPVVEAYAGKIVLLTGTTGFLGKVLLEKVLYALVSVKKVYILIRAKKGSKLIERFKKEILDSPCFDRLRQKLGNKFEDYIEQKIRPVQGDLLKQGLGLSPEDLTELTENLEVIINCAASIDFNARLDDAININIKGTLQMLELARKCKKLLCFTHVSTCYVNCNMKGHIREEIYPKDIDPDSELAELLSIPVKDLVARTNEILAKDNYPNTYTFTKALCERILQKKRGDVPLCIIRPAIIVNSYKDPFEGWIDSVAAAAAVFLFVGLGVIRELKGNVNYIGDIIPVDIVVDFSIVATAEHFGQNRLQVYNVGSSDRNPINWQECGELLISYWNNSPSVSRVGKTEVRMNSNDKLIAFNKMKRRIPVFLYNKAATLIGSKEHIKQSQRAMKSLNRAEQIHEIFEFFVNNSWVYESRKVDKLIDKLNSEDKALFLVDVSNINKRHMMNLNNYGLQKFILKENVESPSKENSNLLQVAESKTYFSDIKWAFKEGGKKIQSKGLNQLKSVILNSKRVQDIIVKEAESRTEFSTDQSKLFQTTRKRIEKEAEDIVQEMFGEFRMPVLRFFAWALTKIFKNIYEKVNINEDMLAQLREIQEKEKIPIVLVPTHRSYLDFLIVSYIFFSYKLKCPRVASDEVLLRMSLIPYLLKCSGGFFIKREPLKKSKLYRAILTEYIEQLLLEGNNLEFFIEGSRSRSGKTLEPQLDILTIIVDAVLEQRVSEVCVVPLTINYEKVLEGDTFPEELLGQDKVEESLLRVLRAGKLLRVNYGRVYVEFCQPIFLNSYIKSQINNDFNPYKRKEQRKELVSRLGHTIVLKMIDKIVIMSTSVVSAVLLMHRKGITEDLLIDNVHWLTKEILNRGYRIGGINESSPNIAVRNAINHLEDITTRTKKNIFELQISAGSDYHKILMLAYYRNMMIHPFLPEALVGFAQNSFGTQLAYKDGVPVERLIEETTFLTNIFQNEFIMSRPIRNEQDVLSALETLVQRRVLIHKDNKVYIDPKGERMITFYVSFMRPLASAYWATVGHLLNIKHNHDRIQETNLEKFEEYVQWFAESLYTDKTIDHYESCSLETLKNSIKTYEKMQILSIKEYPKEKRVEILANEEKLMELENHLRNFVGTTKPPGDMSSRSASLMGDLLPKL